MATTMRSREIFPPGQWQLSHDNAAFVGSFFGACDFETLYRRFIGHPINPVEIADYVDAVNAQRMLNLGYNDFVSGDGGVPVPPVGCGSQSGIGSPVGVKTPAFLNQLYHDTDADAYWRSNGLTSADWTEISGGGPAINLTVGLTHYWNLNEASGDSLDSVGSLTLVRGAGVTTVAGPIDNAVEVNNAVFGWSLSSANTSMLLPTTGATIHWWERASADIESWTVLAQASGFGINALAFDFEPESNGDMYVTIRGADGQAAGLHVGHNFPQTADGNWHSYAIRRSSADGVSTIYFFIDGVLISTNYTTETNPSVDLPLVIGDFSGNNPGIPVDISDLGAWSRALTDGEIVALYNAGAGNRYPFT